MNIALITKWWWRFKTESNSLWKSVIQAIHGVTGNLGASSKGGLWNQIANIDKCVECLDIQLPLLFCRKLGDGKSTKFWSEIWCGSKTMEERFPRLAALERSQDCYVANRISKNSITTRWNWRRDLVRSRELDELEELQCCCSNTSFSGHFDRWEWNLEGREQFSVASLRKFIDSRYLKKGHISTRWNVKVPIKVRLHLWRAQRDRLPTKSNLAKRGVGIDCDRCVLCKADQETNDHLFASCPKSTEVRTAVNRWWNGSIKLQGIKALEIFGQEMVGQKASWRDCVKDMITEAYAWIIWKGRNDEAFRGTPFNSLRAANDIQSTVFSWVCSRCNKSKVPGWIDWCCNPMTSMTL